MNALRHRRSRRAFAPRHRRSNIATHIGALVLLVAWPAAVGAAGAGAEAGIAVQDVLPQLPLPAGPAKPANTGSTGLEQRVSRIEGILPRLATKGDLRATEAKLEVAIANLRTEMREQFRDYLLINSGMITMMGAFLLWVVKNMLLPANLEGPVGTAVRRLRKKRRKAKRRRASRDKPGGEGGDEGEGGSKRP